MAEMTPRNIFSTKANPKSEGGIQNTAHEDIHRMCTSSTMREIFMNDGHISTMREK
jgi:hypothetical protein